MMKDLENEESYEILTCMDGEFLINDDQRETEFTKKEFWIFF